MWELMLSGGPSPGISIRMVGWAQNTGTITRDSEKLNAKGGKWKVLLLFREEFCF